MRIYFGWLVLMVVVLSSAGVGLAEEKQPYTGKPSFGARGKVVPLPDDERYESQYGLQVTSVSAGSTADNAKVRIGDVIVSINGSVWTNKKSIPIADALAKGKGQPRPGMVADMLVLSAPAEGSAGERELREITITLQRLPRTAEELPFTPDNAQLRPDLVGDEPIYKKLCWDLIRSSGFESDSLDLLKRLEQSEQYPDPDRLAIVRYARRDPFKLEAVSRELIKHVDAKGGLGAQDVPKIIALARHVLFTFNESSAQVGNIGNATESVEASYEGKDVEGHLDYIESVLAAAAELHKQAFAELSEEDAQYIIEHRLQMLVIVANHASASISGKYKQQHVLLRMLEMIDKVDVEALLAQAEVASLLVDPQFTTSLRQAVESSGLNLKAGVIKTRATPYGPILIAGKARTRYMKTHYAAIYELGGDDVYANNQGSSMWGIIPTSIVVDYQGDDAYETHAPMSQACGDMGVGMIVDMSGNDSYVGTFFTQGTGFLGVGVLVDEAGDDVYRGIKMSQGVGNWGFGALLDRAGNDRYEAHVYAQGVGLPGGFGLLSDSGNGDDNYYCKGLDPTGYGTDGVFEGWGQGVAMGYRPYASGGVGVVYDQGGSDYMEAGNFSQGGGYFYGMGLLFADGKENDHYIGSRYNQAFSAHHASGIMIEAGGDDRYTTRNFVAQGLAWDESSSLFLDESGNDRYEGGSFSQGASAMNGWSIFIDLDGEDTYLYTDQARNGGNTYHGGTSLSFFVDAGGDEDHYPSKPNNKIVTGGVRSIFVDLPGSLEDVFKDQLIEELMAQPEAE